MSHYIAYEERGIPTTSQYRGSLGRRTKRIGIFIMIKSSVSILFKDVPCFITGTNIKNTLQRYKIKRNILSEG